MIQFKNGSTILNIKTVKPIKVYSASLFPSKLFKLKVYCRDGYWIPFKNAVDLGKYKVTDYTLTQVIKLVQETI